MPLRARIAALAALALIGSAAGAAVPATAAGHHSHPVADPGVTVPYSQVLRQPGGYQFRAVLTDARAGGLFEVDGYSVSRDRAGTWHYVSGRDAQGRVQLAHAVGPAGPPASVAPHAGRQQTRVSAKEEAARASILRQLQVASYRAQLAAAAEGEERVFHVPALMLATWYDEDAGETTPQFHDGHDAAYFKKILDGFGGNPNGSVTQFYYEASFGQFLVEIDVFGPYTSAESIGDPCHYGTPDDGDLKVTDPAGSVLGVGGAGALGMAVEAVPQTFADPGMDWSKYDNDGDGQVDFTIIIHSGSDHAFTSDPCDTHSHALQATLGLPSTAESTLGLPAGTLKAGIPTNSPGVFVDRVVTIPERGSLKDPLTIGVAAHEMAHALGEPDYYDTAYTSNGTGDFDIMAGGSYMGDPAGSNPTMFNPATRVFQGWVTPTVVHGDLNGYTLAPRTALPAKGYHVGMVDPNLLLVPTYEVAVGDTDSLGHTWTQEDVYGLATDPKTGKFVVEGYYVENVSRDAVTTKLSPQNPSGSMFDHRQHASGLLVWHFDYWRQSTTYFGHGNDAQSDPNRYQMDVEEFDQNDNTQELQLNYSRGNPADFLVGAATGITSGTHEAPPGVPTTSGEPQEPVELTGTSAPVAGGSVQFDVEDNPNNQVMTVTVASDNMGDCKLSLTDPSGTTTAESDAGSFGDPESITVKKPAAGTWTANVGDFAACLQFSGRAVFTGASAFNTQGAADTWSSWTEKPTGWAFTNVSGYGNGIDNSPESGDTSTITLDVLDLSGDKDVSPGFVTGRLNAGRDNVLTVPVFSNGGKAPGKVDVVVHSRTVNGPVVARKQVGLGAYERKDVRFTYRPAGEGVTKLVTVVDPADRISEGSERNQAQVTTLWSGPKDPSVLVVDDDQTLAHERAIAGALAALGVPYAIAAKSPNATEMGRYGAVIWENGTDRGPGVLAPGDVAALKRYLDGGGRLLLSTNRPDGVSSVVDPTFAGQYLGIRTPEGNASYVASQSGALTFSGAGLLKGTQVTSLQAPARPFFGLSGLSSAGNGALGTAIDPLGTATGILTAPESALAAVVPAEDPPYVGIAVDGDAAHQSFRTVTLGWNLGDDAKAAETLDLLGTVLKHFGVRTGRYHPAGKPVVYTTAVRDDIVGRAIPVTAVVLGGRAAPVVLHYRTHDGVWRSAPMRSTGHGTYQGTIPGSVVTFHGVDYYLTVRGRSDLAGYPGPLFHGVGVAIG
ncbi:immune inhibitor A domain-containing protein [Nocardioides sp. URHA0032]|uniref:immune inhibitor A domain-containing protein n=1 Tax=Nocardioides sp. URHA0032 TaxID=1380388 RepID=UPI00048D1E2B|nr:immune inhibitor A domain-containing protein [Nocardioides sp. URHA0032]